MKNIKNTRCNHLIRMYIVIFLFSILISLSGLRSGNDPDYKNYQEIYHLASTNSQVYVEPFFIYLNKIFYSINFGFEALIFFIALISISIKGFVILKESEFVFFSFLIYLSSCFVLFDVIAIRQGCALAFAMLAFRDKYNYVQAILLIIIASLFHTSALVLTPFLFIVNLKHNKNVLLLYLFFIFSFSILKINVSIVDVFYAIPGLPNHLSYKFKVYSSYGQPAYLSLKQLLVLLVSVVVYFKASSSRYIKCVSLLYVYGCLVAILLSGVGDISYRLKWYFFFSEIFIIPKFFMQIRITTLRKKLSASMLFLITFMVLYIYPMIELIQSIHERGFSLFL